MSRANRRTMRRLKRMLGVTAIILALLIAAIPDMGQASETDPLLTTEAEGTQPEGTETPQAEEAYPQLVAGTEGTEEPQATEAYPQLVAGTEEAQLTEAYPQLVDPEEPASAGETPPILGSAVNPVFRTTGSEMASSVSVQFAGQSSWELASDVDVEVDHLWSDDLRDVFDGLTAQKGDGYDTGATGFSLHMLGADGQEVDGDSLEGLDAWGQDVEVVVRLDLNNANRYGALGTSELQNATIELYEVTGGTLLGNAIAVGGYGSTVSFTVGGPSKREYLMFYYANRPTTPATAASVASTAVSVASTATSSSAATGGTSNTGSTSYSSFEVDDVRSYAYAIGLIDGAGASGYVTPAPTGIWRLYLQDDQASILHDLCEREVGLESGAPFQGFQFASLTRDGSSVAGLPDGTTLYLTMPLPDTLQGASSIDVRRLNTDHGNHAEKVQAQLVPAKDAVDTTNDRDYVMITIPDAKFALRTSYAMFATPVIDSGTGSSTTGGKITVDTPQATKDEDVPAGTTDDVSDIWGLGTPTAAPDGLEVADYRLLITRYPTPKTTTVGKAIINQKSFTGYNSSKSTIRAYEIRLKKTKNGTVTYPATTEELGGGKVKVTIPVQTSLAKNSGTVQVYTLRNGSSLEAVPTSYSETGATATFVASHFSQYAVLYTPGKPQPSPSPSGNSASSSSSTGRSSSSSNSSSNGSSSSAASNTSRNNTGATTNTTNTGGGGNRASGVDMPRTADATTYKAIFILILLTFGAFELISSIPPKREGKE